MKVVVLPRRAYLFLKLINTMILITVCEVGFLRKFRVEGEHHLRALSTKTSPANIIMLKNDQTGQL